MQTGIKGMNYVTPDEFKAALMLVSGEGNGTPLQYSCLENPMEGGAWEAVVREGLDTTE